MRTEVHVHGSLYLRKGVSASQINKGLHKWLEYLDLEHFDEMNSLEPDEPGVTFDPNARVLDICWTGEVGRSFQRTIQEMLLKMSPLLEHASEIELTFYHEDGRDEYQVIFAGPSAESIHQAQRRRMVEDVSGLLSRHFGISEVQRVERLLQQLFDEDWQQRSQETESPSQSTASLIPFRSNKHLH